jgi:hypothetical protein
MSALRKRLKKTQNETVVPVDFTPIQKLVLQGEVVEDKRLAQLNVALHLGQGVAARDQSATVVDNNSYKGCSVVRQIRNSSQHQLTTPARSNC